MTMTGSGQTRKLIRAYELLRTGQLNGRRKGMTLLLKTA